MTTVNTVTISIYGKELTIKTSEDAKITQEYASYIDARMKDIGQRSGSFDANRIAMLALLSITHELFALRRQSEADQTEYAERMKRLMGEIDELLATVGAAEAE